MTLHVSEKMTEVIWSHLRSFGVIIVMRQQKWLYYKDATLAVLFLWGLITYIGRSGFIISDFFSLDG